MATIGRINTIISATTAPLTTGLSRAQSSIMGFGSSIVGMTKRLVPLAAGLAGTAALLKGFKDAATFEQTEIAFKTLLGSAEKARNVIAGIQKFAAETPFEMPELASAGRSLAAFGVESENIVPTLRRIGDISSGIGAPISEIAELYGKAKVQGRLFAMDINQLTGRGIPIIGQLAKQFGVAESKVMKLVTAGKVGFPEIEKAFVAMTSEGGQFAGLMEAQSKSLGGLWSTFKDNVSIAFRDLAIVIIETFNFKGMIARMGSLAEGFKSVIKRIKPVLIQFSNTVKAVWNVIAESATTLWNFLGLGGGNTFEQIKNFVLDFLITAEFVFQNIGPIAELMWEKIKLGAVSTWENIKHFFTVQIPTVLTWLSKNWHDVWKTVFDYTSTVFINLGKNIRGAMKAIWDYIKSGGKGGLNIAWTPLTEGFKNAVKELPDIPDRAISELEKKLQTNVDQMGGNLTDRLGDHMAKRREELLGQAASDPFAKVEGLETKDKLEIGMNDKLADKIDDLEGAASVQRGSSDAFSQIFKAMRGDGVQELMLTEAKSQTKKLTTAVSELKKIASKEPALVAGTV